MPAHKATLIREAVKGMERGHLTWFAARIVDVTVEVVHCFVIESCVLAAETEKGQ